MTLRALAMFPIQFIAFTGFFYVAFGWMVIPPSRLFGGF